MSRVMGDCSRSWRRKLEIPFADSGEVERRYTASWLEEADSVGLLQVLTNFDSLSEGGRRRSNSATAVTLVNTQVLENDDKKLSCWYTVSLKLRWFCS